MSSPPERGVVAAIPAATIDHLAGRPGAGAAGVAHAVVASPAWRSLGGAVAVVREQPAPVLAVLGSFDAAQAARLDALAWQLDTVAPTLRILDHRDVDEATTRLADELRARLGPGNLRRASFRAIPRGGHIVLGTLAYLLDLDAAQLGPDHTSDGPLVVVDDCALSGRRFREWRAAHPTDRPVVLAVLAAAPGLQRALERAGGLRACVAAVDLRDLAPEQQGDGYAAWVARWRERCPDELWIGHPEPICFPWNEPDIGTWNPVTERVEAGWRLVPPDRCLKNRRGPTGDAAPIVRFEVDPSAPVRPADDVVAAEVAGAVVVAAADTGRAVRLDGVAADVWRALLTAGDVPGTVDLLQAMYEAPAARLTGDVEGLIAQLVAAGLLRDDRPAIDAALAAAGGPAHRGR